MKWHFKTLNDVHDIQKISTQMVPKLRIIKLCTINSTCIEVI
jgi:hypothetical protein